VGVRRYEGTNGTTTRRPPSHKQEAYRGVNRDLFKWRFPSWREKWRKSPG
jgi:hypothetical protein